MFGITTTIPVLGTSATVDVSKDDGDWADDDDYDAGDIVVDPIDGNQYRATVDIAANALKPSQDGRWVLAGSAQLVGSSISLNATVSTLNTKVRVAKTLSGTNDTLDVDDVSGFSNNGTFTIVGNPTLCTYTGRTVTLVAGVKQHSFTGVSACDGAVTVGQVVKKDIEENGSGTGINHAGLDLEYHANVNLHGDTHVTATGDVTLASAVDVTATSKASGGVELGAWVSGTNYTKGDIVTDDGKRYAATKDIVNSTRRARARTTACSTTGRTSRTTTRRSPRRSCSRSRRASCRGRARSRPAPATSRSRRT